MGLSERFKKKENKAENNVVTAVIPDEPTYSDFSQFNNVEFNDLETDDIERYLDDVGVTKIVITDSTAKIYRNGNFSETITPVSYTDFSKKTVSKCIKKNFVVTSVCPPVSEKPCITFERIQFFSPEELVKQNFTDTKTLEFIEKCVFNRKNILLTQNSNLFNTIILHYLKNCDVTLIQELPKIKNRDNITTFSISQINESEFENVLNIVENINSEYVLTDINNDRQMQIFFSCMQNVDGKICNIRAGSAQAALSKVLNMIMNEENCSEKSAKSKLLDCFQYIVDKNKIYLITPAKTSILTLTEVNPA